LYGHYRLYYAPNNAIAVAVGDFDSGEMLAKIKAYYGQLKPSDHEPPPVFRTEPEQTGERRVEVERPGNTAFLEVMYRAPAVTDDDWFAFSALDSILGGPSGPGGGNIDNKTSRLYRGLVETGIAADISGHLFMSKDPFAYSITVVVRPDRTLDEAENTLHGLIESLVDDQPITQAELDKAKKQARAAFAYATENVTGQARWLGYAEILGDYTLFTHFVDKLEAVTLEDVQRVAATYLKRSKRTVGRFIPIAMEEGEMMEMEEDYA
jgi:zinc protease